MSYVYNYLTCESQYVYDLYRCEMCGEFFSEESYKLSTVTTTSGIGPTYGKFCENCYSGQKDVNVIRKKK